MICKNTEYPNLMSVVSRGTALLAGSGAVCSAVMPALGCRAQSRHYLALHRNACGGLLDTSAVPPAICTHITPCRDED